MFCYSRGNHNNNHNFTTKVPFSTATGLLPQAHLNECDDLSTKNPLETPGFPQLRLFRQLTGRDSGLNILQHFILWKNNVDMYTIRKQNEPTGR